MKGHSFRLFSAILLAILCTDTIAGKMANPEPLQWNNIYIGGQIGHGWSDSDWRFVNPNFFNTLGPTILGSRFNFGKNGTNAGALLGFNAQFNYLVVGLEGSISDASLAVQGLSPYFPTTDFYSTSLHWYSLLKGKAGLAINQFLIYGTGGWAGSRISLAMNSPSFGVNSSAKRWITGWTAGAGIDYRLNQNVAIGTVYDYIKVRSDNETLTCPNCGVGVGLGTPIVKGNAKLKTLSVKATYLFNV